MRDEAARGKMNFMCEFSPGWSEVRLSARLTRRYRKLLGRQRWIMVKN